MRTLPRGEEESELNERKGRKISPQPAQPPARPPTPEIQHEILFYIFFLFHSFPWPSQRRAGTVFPSSLPRPFGLAPLTRSSLFSMARQNERFYGEPYREDERAALAHSQGRSSSAPPVVPVHHPVEPVRLQCPSIPFLEISSS